MSWTKNKINNLFFLIGIVAVVAMLLTFDVSFIELWHYICHAGYWMFPIVGIWLVVYILNALSWREVIKGVLGRKNSNKPSFWRILRLTITGYALNYATPVGGLGGEPYRIIELSRDIEKDKASSSVILYAMMHIFAHFWLWFTSIFFYLILVLIGNLTLPVGTAIVLLLIGILCLCAFYLFIQGYKHGIVLTILRIIGYIPGLKGWRSRFCEKHRETLENIDRQIATLHSQDKRAFYHSFFLEYLSRIVQSLEIMFMLLLFGIDCGGGTDGMLLTFFHSVLILAFTSLFANLIGFLPMQLGVQEGGFMISISAMGLSPEIGMFVSIISRVREIIWIFIGIVLMKMNFVNSSIH